MIDRYTKTVLTLIAIALVYICIVLTPLPGVQAQTARRPGDPTGPGEMVIVGWRAPELVAISTPRPLPVNVVEPVRVAGKVVTEPADDNARRVVLVGWEENANRAHTNPGSMKPIAPNVPKTPGLPITVK